MIDPDEVLKQEFAYARDTALQANGDRTQVVSLYLLLVGGVGSVLLGLPALGQGAGLKVSPRAYALVLAALALLGVFSVLEIVKLRRAWHDSVLAMNQIKDFYLLHFPDLAPAFRWRTASIPASGALWTISFDLVLLVAFIDSLALGGAAIFFGLGATEGAVASGTLFVAQLAAYRGLLR